MNISRFLNFDHKKQDFILSLKTLLKKATRFLIAVQFFTGMSFITTNLKAQNSPSNKINSIKIKKLNHQSYYLANKNNLIVTRGLKMQKNNSMPASALQYELQTFLNKYESIKLSQFVDETRYEYKRIQNKQVHVIFAKLDKSSKVQLAQQPNKTLNKVKVGYYYLTEPKYYSTNLCEINTDSSKKLASQALNIEEYLNEKAELIEVDSASCKSHELKKITTQTMSDFLTEDIKNLSSCINNKADLIATSPYLQTYFNSLSARYLQIISLDKKNTTPIKVTCHDEVSVKKLASCQVATEPVVVNFNNKALASFLENSSPEKDPEKYKIFKNLFSHEFSHAVSQEMSLENFTKPQCLDETMISLKNEICDSQKNKDKSYIQNALMKCFENAQLTSSAVSVSGSVLNASLNTDARTTLTLLSASTIQPETAAVTQALAQQNITPASFSAVPEAEIQTLLLAQQKPANSAPETANLAPQAQESDLSASSQKAFQVVSTQLRQTGEKFSQALDQALAVKSNSTNEPQSLTASKIIQAPKAGLGQQLIEALSPLELSNERYGVSLKQTTLKEPTDRLASSGLADLGLADSGLADTSKPSLKPENSLASNEKILNLRKPASLENSATELATQKQVNFAVPAKAISDSTPNAAQVVSKGGSLPSQFPEVKTLPDAKWLTMSREIKGSTYQQIKQNLTNETFAENLVQQKVQIQDNNGERLAGLSVNPRYCFKDQKQILVRVECRKE